MSEKNKMGIYRLRRSDQIQKVDLPFRKLNTPKW